MIKQQCPDATRVAGYRTWQEEFNRHVLEGEQAIWIWAPIITKRCPACENSPRYHENSDCEYDETPPEEWSEGLVGFKPAPVFDVSQTEGEPLPELQTVADATVAISPIVLKALVERNVLERAEAVELLEELADQRDWLGAPIYRRAQELSE